MKNNTEEGFPQPLKMDNILTDKDYSSGYINVSLYFDILILKALPVPKKGDQ
jgi:hypothetical protein